MVSNLFKIVKPILGVNKKFRIECKGNNKLKLDNITSIGLWVGMALVVLAWIKAIPLLYGWFGFAIAVPSFIVEAINNRNMPPSNGDDNLG